MDSRENTAMDGSGTGNGKGGLGRRQFIGTAAAALFAGVVIHITGCTTDEAENSPAAGGNSATIVGNHGHSAVVTKAMIDAGGAITLDIRGSSGHTHTLELTSAEMETIMAKLHVMKDTSERSEATDADRHKHIAMFN